MESHERGRTFEVNGKAGKGWRLRFLGDFRSPSVEERPASSVLASLALLQTLLAPSCAFPCGQPGCHRRSARLLSSEQGTRCDGNTLVLLVYEKGEQDPVFSKTTPKGSSTSLWPCDLSSILIRATDCQLLSLVIGS